MPAPHSKPPRPTAPGGHAAPIALLVTAAGLLVFFRLHADALLAAAIDPLHADWENMQRAFGAYTLYAVGTLATLASLVVWLVRRTPFGQRLRGAAPRRITVAFAVVLAAAVVLTLVDVLIFQDYGIHFYDFNVVGILGDAALRRDLGIQPAQVLAVSAASVILIAAEVALCALSLRLAAWRNGALGRVSVATLAGSAVLGLALLGGFETAISSGRADFDDVLPLGRVLLLRAGSGPHIAAVPRLGAAGYPVLRRGPAPRLVRRPNIVFFVADGLRADMVTPTLAPNLTAFGMRADVIRSRRHFSTGHVSESGLFGLAYAADAQAYHAFLAARVPAFPLDLLRRNGYRTLLISSSRINPYPTDQLLRVFDDVRYPRTDDEAIAMLARFVEDRRRDGVPYFVLTFVYTPHYPFTSAKPAFQRYPLVGPSARTNYMNDVLQADDYFRQAFALVRDDFDHGRTIMLATSDHGEEIRDHGVFGHAPATFWNEKVLVPFFLGLPGARLDSGERAPARSSHVDVWPTIFDYTGLSPALPPASYSDGESLLRPRSGDRALYVYGRYFPEADRPSAVIDGDRKYWFRVAGVGAFDGLCATITRVTDLEDRAEDVAQDAATARALTHLQADFWHFIAPEAGARPANCTTIAESLHHGGDAAPRSLSQSPTHVILR